MSLSVPLSSVVLWGVGLLAVHHLFGQARHVWRLYWKSPDLPWVWCLIQPYSLLGSVIPSFPTHRGMNFIWDERETLYEDTKAETLLFVPVLWGEPIIVTSSPDLHDAIQGYNSQFTKWKMATKGLDAFGPNVVASVGEQWRRHRKVAAPAFDQKVYEHVWDEVNRLYKSMVKHESWEDKSVIEEPQFDMHTMKIAVSVISACGFNEPLPWTNPLHTDTSAEPTIQNTIRGVSKGLLARLMIPTWWYKLPVKGLRDIDWTFKAFEQAMHKKIQSRKAELRGDVVPDANNKSAELSGVKTVEDGKDVFTRLILASERDSTMSLTDQELLGNSFVFIFAGHETTAYTMAITCAFLALYPEEQERVYQVVKSVTGGGDPALTDYNDLAPVLECFYEAARLYPAGYISLRESTADAAVTVPKYDGSKHTILFPQAMPIAIDMIGTNRNPRHFPNPHSFVPTRWSSGVDSFLGFSTGPRACLGRKFAVTEALCFLTLMLRDWKMEPIMKEGETKKMWEERVLHPKLGITLTTGNIPIRLKARV